MKEGWTYKKLGEVGITQTGTTPSKSNSENYGGNIPFIRPAEIPADGSGCIIYDTEIKLSEEGVKNGRLFKSGSILMVCIGSIGKLGYLDRDASCNQQINILTPHNDYNSKFVFYAMSSPSFQKESLKIAQGAQATLPIINKSKWTNLTIPIAPLPTQQRIVSYLDTAFAQIDALKAKAEKQLNEAKALFQKTLAKAMEPKEGWEEKRLPDISENLDSIRVPVTKKNRNGGIYPYYGASGIVDYVDDYLFDEDLLCISEDGANLIMRTYPIAFPISGKVWVNNHAHVLRFNNMTTQKYIEYFFEGLKLDDYITGAAQPKLTQKALNNIPIYIPSNIPDQHRIVAYLDSLSEKVKSLETNLNKVTAECAALKQSILRQVFE